MSMESPQKKDSAYFNSRLLDISNIEVTTSSIDSVMAQFNELIKEVEDSDLTYDRKEAEKNHINYMIRLTKVR